MIKLDDLKEGDVIYRACKYYHITKYKILRAKYEFEYQDYSNESILYAVKVEDITKNTMNKGYIYTLCQDCENELFNTIEEAKDYKSKCRQQRINYLQDKDILIESLYTYAAPFLGEEDKKIYQEIIYSKESNRNV